MDRFINLGTTAFNIDHIVGFAQPVNMPTQIQLSIAGSPVIGVKEKPDILYGLIKMAGAGGEFIQLTSTTLTVGKQWLAHRFIACIQPHQNGANILLAKAGAPPETVRESQERVRDLIRQAVGVPTLGVVPS